MNEIIFYYTYTYILKYMSLWSTEKLEEKKIEAWKKLEEKKSFLEVRVTDNSVMFSSNIDDFTFLMVKDFLQNHGYDITVEDKMITTDRIAFEGDSETAHVFSILDICGWEFVLADRGSLFFKRKNIFCFVFVLLFLLSLR